MQRYNGRQICWWCAEKPELIRRGDGAAAAGAKFGGCAVDFRMNRLRTFSSVS